MIISLCASLLVWFSFSVFCLLLLHTYTLCIHHSFTPWTEKKEKQKKRHFLFKSSCSAAAFTSSLIITLVTLPLLLIPSTPCRLNHPPTPSPRATHNTRLSRPRPSQRSLISRPHWLGESGSGEGVVGDSSLTIMTSVGDSRTFLSATFILWYLSHRSLGWSLPLIMMANMIH